MKTGREIQGDESRDWKLHPLLLSLPLVSLGCFLVLLSILHEPAAFSRTPTTNISTGCTHPKRENASQVVFMLIDAWRFDFLAADDSPMTFLRGQIDRGEALMLRSKVHVPTVTEPRIKAMTAGTNPSFVSLVNNFFSAEMTTDNWVKRAYDGGKRVLFYGDDTWLRLFPGPIFHDSVGVPSFNVPDYTDVDNNVTYHMRRQIGQFDWDVMILHYLGLDHIGHSLSGESEQIPVKLKEMDKIVKEMYQRAAGPRDLTIVVVGDHGMTPQGSHGGSTAQETATPIFVTRTGQKGRGRATKETVTVEQIDIVSLMSFLLGQELPTGSLGVSVVEQLERIWSLSPSDVATDFLSHLTQWTSIVGSGDEQLGYLRAEAAGKTCQEVMSAVGPKHLSSFYAAIRSHQQNILSQPQQIGGIRYFLGLLCIVAAAGVAVYSLGWGLAAPESLFLPMPVVACLSSSLVEEEHEIWYYCVPATVLLHLWRQNKAKFPVAPTLGLLLLHRFAQSASSGVRRRWIMAPELLSGILPEDSAIFVPLREAGHWLHSNLIFPKENVLIGGFYLLCLAICTKYSYRTRSGTVSSLLQTATGLVYLFGFTNAHQWLISVSSWLWILLLPLGVAPAIILYLSCIVRPTLLPVILATHVIGSLSRQLSLDRVSVSLLLGSALFYMGLSNSVSSIDIRVGYAGLQEYNALLVGAQIVANMYAPMLFFILGVGDLKSLLPKLSMFVSIRVLILVASVLALLIFSEHLFVWTVFTPKVIFDVVHLHISMLILLVIYFCSKFV